jgi:hypothetical protein
MATDQPITLDLEFLNFTAASLGDRADALAALISAMKNAVVTNALTTLTNDLKLASTIAERLAHLRFEVAEIAAKSTDPDAARELRDALDDAAKGV